VDVAEGVGGAGGDDGDGDAAVSQLSKFYVSSVRRSSVIALYLTAALGLEPHR